MNTGHWTQEECNLFNEAWNVYPYDWEKISAHVRTRSIEQVRNRAYRNFIRNESQEVQKGPWSMEEMKLFYEGLYNYGKNWSEISKYIKTRNPSQVLNFFYRNLCSDPWTIEEHDRFFDALEIYGYDWVKIAEHVKTKDVHQIIDHMKDFGDTDQFFNKGKWTENEKEKFIQGFMNHPFNWHEISNHIGTRNHTQVINYAYRLHKVS